MYDPYEYVAGNSEKPDRNFRMEPVDDSYPAISVPLLTEDLSRERWARKIIAMMRIAYERGRSHGAEEARVKIRQALGIFPETSATGDKP